MEHLLLLHGALGGADQLRPLEEKLKSQFNTHVLEFNGHGIKSAHSGAFSLDDFIQQLNDRINDIGESTHIFGYSMGGFVALMAAARGNQSIKSITTLGTKMKWSPEIASSEVRHLDADKIKEKVPKFFESLQQQHGEHWIEVLDRTANFMKALGEENPMQQEVVNSINCPVNLLLADQDQMVSEEETKEVHSWIANSQFHVIEKSYHPIDRVNIDFLTESISTFIG